MDNFDQRMEAISPRAAFNVDNTLTGDGQLSVDLTFKTIEDFSPGKVAKSVPALANLLEARQQLNDLLLYMDGKDGAQELLDQLLKDPGLLKAMSAAKLEKESGKAAASDSPKAKSKPAQPIPEGTKK